MGESPLTTWAEKMKRFLGELPSVLIVVFGSEKSNEKRKRETRDDPPLNPGSGESHFCGETRVYVNQIQKRICFQTKGRSELVSRLSSKDLRGKPQLVTLALLRLGPWSHTWRTLYCQVAISLATMFKLGLGIGSNI